MCSVKELEKRKLIFQYLDINTLYEGFFFAKITSKASLVFEISAKARQTRLRSCFLHQKNSTRAKEHHSSHENVRELNCKATGFVNPGKYNVCSLLIKLQKHL